MQYSDTNPSTLYGIIQDIYFLAKVNSASIDDGDLNRIINKAYLKCQQVIRGINENFYLVVATTDLVIGDGSYTYPDGSGTAPAYEKLKSLWAAYTPANTAAPLVTEFSRVIIADPNAITNPAYTFSTPTALLFNDYFVLQPFVTDTTMYPVTGGVKIYYISQLQKLVNPTDVPLIFPDYHEAIVHGALIDVAQRIGNKELKTDSIKTFKEKLEDIETFASNRLPDESSIVEGQEASGGWVYPWGQNSMS